VSDSKFVFAVPARGVGFAPVHYAAHEGLFRRHGLDVDVIYLEGGPACAEALLAGKIDLTSVLGPLVRCAMKDGARGFRVIAGMRKKLEFAIVGKPQLNSIQDLAGRSLESPHGDWSGGTYLKYVLRQLGLEGKIRLLYSYVTQEQRLEGLLKGEFEAGLLAGEKVLMAQERGFKVLVPFDQALPEISSSALATTVAQLETRRNDVKAFIRAIVEASREMRDSPEKFVDFLRRHFSMSREMAAAFQARQSPNFTLPIEIDSVQKEIDISHEVHGFPRIEAEEIVDLTLLAEVMSENK
jgi:NitT/TauT family transport system substrate-binding protein